MELGRKLFSISDRFLTEGRGSDLGKENANFIRSLPVLENILLGEICKDILFTKIYKDLPIIKQLHDLGFIYHHQSAKLGPYCIGLSSQDLAVKGLRSNATNERASSPPKRIDTLLSQAANLICLLAQEVSGATSINDLSTVLAGYLYHQETELGQVICHDYIQNAWQSFMYNINLPFRSGNSPFSNVTLDFSKATPTLRDKSVAYAGEYLNYTYGDIPSVYYDRINYAFIDAMTRGDSLHNPFTFPLITVNITDDFDYKNPCWLYFLERSESFGGFYLQNYCTTPFTEEARKINPFHSAYDLGMLYSNCCRVTFDINELLGVTGSNPFASGSGVGGINVIGINLNRIMWLSQGKEELLYPMVDYIIDIAAEALETKRRWLKQNWVDLFPYLSYYVKNDTTLFSIISVLGAHEGLKSAGFARGIYDEQGKIIAHNLAKHIHDKVKALTQQYGNAFTLEFAPSESAACKLAEKDLSFACSFVDNPDIGVTDENGAQFFKRLVESCHAINNSLLFREVADLEDEEEIKPEEILCHD